MAATVTTLLTVVSNADTASSNGTWLGNSGAADTEVKIQGNGSYTWMAAKNARTSCTFTPTTNLDMSGTAVHLYWWTMNAVAAFIEPFQEIADAPGYTLRLTDGSSNYKEWRIAGSDTWGGEWRCFILDVNSTTDVYASSGTLDLSDIDIITWSVDMSNSGNIRIIDNQWNDVVRFGTGLKVTGTDFDITNIAAIDENSSNKYGVLENIDGVIFCQGSLQIGDGTTTTTTFNSTDEVLIFRDRNSDGLGQVSDDLYRLTLSGTGVTANVKGLVAKGAGITDTTRFILDCDDTDISLTLNASTFIRAGFVYFAAGDSITNSSFNDCRQIDPGKTLFKNNSIVDTTSSGGALLVDSDGTSNLSDLSFTSGGTGHGVLITVSGTYSFINFTYSNYANTNGSTGNEVIYNNSGGQVTINVSGGDTPTYRNGVGASTVISAAYTHTITGLELNTEVTYVTAGTSTELFHVENASVSDGDGKYKTVYTHGGGVTVDVLIHHINYKPDISNIIGITLPNINATVKVQMFEDENYYNPT